MDITSKEFAERLVYEVQKRPILYNNKHPGSNDRYLIEQEWRRLADIFPFTPLALKKRWQNLRGSYSKSLTLTGKRKGANFHLAEQMAFLKEFLTRNTSKPVDRNSADCLDDIVQYSVTDDSQLVADFSDGSVVAADQSRPVDNDMDGEDEEISLQKVFKIDTDSYSPSSNMLPRTSYLPMPKHPPYQLKSVVKRQERHGSEDGDEVPASSHRVSNSNCSSNNIGVDRINADWEFFKGLLPQVGELSRKRKRAFFSQVTQLLFQQLDEEDEESS